MPAKAGEFIRTISPFNETEIAKVHAAGEEDVDRAVAAAREAFRGPWARTTATERGVLLGKLVSLVEEHAETLAAIEAWDSGKPYAQALADEVGEAVSVMRYYAGFADKVHGQVIETENGRHAYTMREPIGVCAQITPWNFAFSMAAWKLAPALATGNCIVLKPSEKTPLSSLYLAGLVKAAGYPPGVVNVVNGDGRVAGAALASHLDVDKIAFTGSTATGKLIQKLAASNLKNISLETGGKSPMVIFEDADLSKAAYWAHLGIMFHGGQNCTANSRIFVHESVQDSFLKLFEKQVREAPIGDPFDAATFQGPQIDEAQRQTILGYIASGKQEGAKLAIGGKAWSHSETGKGYFVEPTVFTGVTESMKICREEIFGPVASVLPFVTEEEVIRRANDTIFGLAAAVFTKDMGRAHRLAKALQSGTVWVNSSNESDIRVPFGGVKQSGIGRECGQAGIEAYTSLKSVIINLDYARL